MNSTLMNILKLALPLIEQFGTQEWASIGLPALKGVAMTLEAGKGQEEAMIMVSAIDQIVQFELKRQVPA